MHLYEDVVLVWEPFRQPIVSGLPFIRVYGIVHTARAVSFSDLAKQRAQKVSSLMTEVYLIYAFHKDRLRYMG